MRPIFVTCQPRDEVLQGELKEEIFAARLEDVLDGTADPIYQDTTRFFENTYPTAGLKLLLEEALGRLTGKRPTNNPIIRLETAFGGGKTHNLIALYHAARGQAGSSPTMLVDAQLVPPANTITIAGIVGSDLDPTVGIAHDDVTTYTLWGELAYQLGAATGIGGAAAYALVADSDRTTRAAPGTGIRDRLVGDHPALIMLDEVARHLRTAKAVATGTGKSDLAEQTVAFLMSLLEFAASKKRVVVVLTLADSSDAFGKETDELRQELGEAQRITARQERVITPTGETEIAAIVNHRLFQQIDRLAAQETADVYRTYYHRLLDQGADLAQRAARPEYAADLITDYPFHPDLLTTLNRKVSTIPNFQRTRGALRLLAAVVRELWQEKPAATFLIHPHHVDLSVGQIADDLTSRLARPAFKQVIEADIVSPRSGSPAHAQLIDTSGVSAGTPPYAERVATAILLHSLTQGTASGVDPADLRLGVIQPEDDPTIIMKAIDRLVDTCWFLDYDGHRYRFKTEPSLNKIVADEMGMVGKTKAKAELDHRIRQIWKKGVFQPVPFPSEASEVDDDAKEPKLVIIHYDAATATVVDSAPPDLVRKIFERAGSLEGYRTYKNNLIFLVADQDQRAHMVEVMQRYLAIARVVGDVGRMGEFNEEQRKKLKQMQDAAELEVRVAITKAYRYLYYPSADALQNHGNLARETLPAQDQGQVDKDQSNVVLRVLRQLDKVLTAEDKPLAPTYVKAKAWDAGQSRMSTEDLRRAFAKRMGLRILLDVNQLKRAIRDGVQHNVWVYYDSSEQVGYSQVSPPPLVQIGDDTLLYVPDEVKLLALPIKGDKKDESEEEKCPLCGNPTSQCMCDPADGNGSGAFARPPHIVLHAEGTPPQAFQALMDQCLDQKVGKVTKLFITVEGSGKAAAGDVRALGLAIPQMGKGQYHVEQQMDAEFDGGEFFSLEFTGTWDRYKKIKSVSEGLGQEATKLTLKTTLRAEFTDGLDIASSQFQTIREIFAALNMGKLVLAAEPAAEGVPV